MPADVQDFQGWIGILGGVAVAIGAFFGVKYKQQNFQWVTDQHILPMLKQLNDGQKEIKDWMAGSLEVANTRIAERVTKMECEHDRHNCFSETCIKLDKMSARLSAIEVSQQELRKDMVGYQMDTANQLSSIRERMAELGNMTKLLDKILAAK